MLEIGNVSSCLTFDLNKERIVVAGGGVTSIDWDTGCAIFLGYFFG